MEPCTQQEVGLEMLNGRDKIQRIALKRRKKKNESLKEFLFPFIITAVKIQLRIKSQDALRLQLS